jgi:hypothetical protein
MNAMIEKQTIQFKVTLARDKPILLSIVRASGDGML